MDLFHFQSQCQWVLAKWQLSLQISLCKSKLYNSRFVFLLMFSAKLPTLFSRVPLADLSLDRSIRHFNTLQFVDFRHSWTCSVQIQLCARDDQLDNLRMLSTRRNSKEKDRLNIYMIYLFVIFVKIKKETQPPVKSHLSRDYIQSPKAFKVCSILDCDSNLSPAKC